MNFCSRLLRLSVFPWCKDSPQNNSHVVVGVIRKFKMARDWFGRIGPNFWNYGWMLTNSLDFSALCEAKMRSVS